MFLAYCTPVNLVRWPVKISRTSFRFPIAQAFRANIVIRREAKRSGCVLALYEFCKFDIIHFCLRVANRMEPSTKAMIPTLVINVSERYCPPTNMDAMNAMAMSTAANPAPTMNSVTFIW